MIGRHSLPTTSGRSSMVHLTGAYYQVICHHEFDDVGRVMESFTEHSEALESMNEFIELDKVADLIYKKDGGHVRSWYIHMIEF